VASVPQLAQFEATSSVGELIVDHRALLMMRDSEEPQLWQATPLSNINWRTHLLVLQRRICLPQNYRYCSCAADSTPPGSTIPVPWPPEPEETPGAGGSGVADAEAATEAGDADAEAGVGGADAATGAPSAGPVEVMPGPMTFPGPSFGEFSEPSGAPRVPP
jgi:hypothetical protein